MTTHRVNGPALWQAVDHKRQSLSMSWRAVGRELDISQSTFTRIRNPEHSIDGAALVSILAWLGLAIGIPDLITPTEEQS